MKEYKNSDMCRAIDEYVHNPRYRKLLRLRFCDGFTYEEIAEEVSFSPQHVRYICTEYKPLLISSL
jgi:RNA polymerase sigma factor (sigma-70 family)